MPGHFITNGVITAIKANKKDVPDEVDIEVNLPAGLASKYVAVKKNYPGNSKKPGNLPKQAVVNGVEYYITWINCFGLKDKSTNADAPADVDEYEIILDNRTGQQLLYYAGGEVKAFPEADLAYPEDQPGKIVARLRLGDPPAGWGGS